MGHRNRRLAFSKTLTDSRAGRKELRGDKRVLKLTISSSLADAIERYAATNWEEGRDKFGALNAVSYIGEQMVAIYRRANGH